MSDERIERLKRAWNDAGVQPSYHEAMKRKLREEWPTLHDAVVAIVVAPSEDWRTGFANPTRPG